jgi:hypothetical protein
VDSGDFIDKFEEAGEIFAIQASRITEVAKELGYKVQVAI